MFEQFTAAILGSNLGPEAQAALEQIANLFKTFTSRGLGDSRTIGGILSVIKSALKLLISYVRGIFNAGTAMMAGVLDIILKIANTPVNIPVLSAIFKALIGEELTLVKNIDIFCDSRLLMNSIIGS
jgi:hypothetical protein